MKSIILTRSWYQNDSVMHVMLCKYILVWYIMLIKPWKEAQ